MVAVAASSQSNWDVATYDAASAYLQADGIDRCLLLRLPKTDPPPGCSPGQVVRANGSIYGTRDAACAW